MKLSTTTLGVFVALASYACFTTTDAFVKAAGQSHLSIFEIGLFLTLFAMPPGFLARPKQDRLRDTFKLKRPALVHLSGFTRMLAGMLGTYSFVNIPFAEVYSIVFLVPVLITVLSVVVLKEDVRIERWLLLLLSFIGTLCVIRPGFKELQLGHLTALGCAVVMSISITTVRMVSGQEPRYALVVTPSLYTIAANLVGVAVVGFVWPGWQLLGVLLVAGLIGGVAYLLQVVALSMAPASRVSPMQYSQIVWALVIGAVIFREIPDGLALAGLAVITLAGVAGIAADRAREHLSRRSILPGA